MKQYLTPLQSAVNLKYFGEVQYKCGTATHAAITSSEGYAYS